VEKTKEMFKTLQSFTEMETGLVDAETLQYSSRIDFLRGKDTSQIRDSNLLAQKEAEKKQILMKW